MIKLHSTVAEITNSSSVTYSWVAEGGVQALKKMIDSVLKESGSMKTSDDLYDIKEVLSSNSMERIMDGWQDEQEEYESYWGATPERKLEMVAEAKKWKFGGGVQTEEEWIKENKCDYESYIETEFEITVKATGEKADILNFLGNLFESESTYDG